MEFERILERARNGSGLSRDEAVFILKEAGCEGPLFGLLLNTADSLSRRQFGNRGEIHAQIGLNWDKCGNNCQFCMFSEELNNIAEKRELGVGEVVARALEFERLKVGTISLMSTADYDFDKYLEMGRAVAGSLRYKTPLFGNWGDIDLSQAGKLKRAGFTYYYHAVRLGEGEVTKLDPGARIESIKNAHRAGLLVGSCLEPIGPEHSYDELADMMLLMRDLNISWMATMKRISVTGSPLNKYGQISDEEFAKITAVTRLFFGKRLFTMAAHEPSGICLRAGANFLVAETGTNPRDGNFETSSNRGRDVNDCRTMLEEAGYEVYSGNVNRRYLRMSLVNRNYTQLCELIAGSIICC